LLFWFYIQSNNKIKIFILLTLSIYFAWALHY
jgi:hypothetical protein